MKEGDGSFRGFTGRNDFLGAIQVLLVEIWSGFGEPEVTVFKAERGVSGEWATERVFLGLQAYGVLSLAA